VTENTALESLVDSWLTLPDAADRLGLDVGKVRRMLQEGRLVGVRRGDPLVVCVPEAFLVPAHLSNPAAPTRPAESDGTAWTVLAALQGTFSVLRDAGFDDESTIEWLFTPDESLPGTPMEALRTGHKTEVRRRAQAQL
jgi:hypothetical protein